MNFRIAVAVNPTTAPINANSAVSIAACQVTCPSRVKLLIKPRNAPMIAPPASCACGWLIAESLTLWLLNNGYHTGLVKTLTAGTHSE